MGMEVNFDLAGKCKEMSEEACRQDSTLRLVRGYYICPVWGERAHWWAVTPQGKIYDPTASQFPSGGMGEYIEFNGVIQCYICSKSITEEEAIIEGNGRYTLCSYSCFRKLVM